LLVNKIKIVNDKGFSYEATLEEGEHTVKLAEQIVQGVVSDFGWGIGLTEFTIEFSINDSEYDPDKSSFELTVDEDVDISYLSELTEITDGDYNYAVTFTKYWDTDLQNTISIALSATKDTEDEESPTESYSYELPYTSATLSEMYINNNECTQYLTDVRLGTTLQTIDMPGETAAHVNITPTAPYGLEEDPPTVEMKLKLYSKNKLTSEYTLIAASTSLDDYNLTTDVALIHEADANDFKVDVVEVIDNVDTVMNSYLFSINAVQG
jgi:hypothetical protein